MTDGARNTGDAPCILAKANIYTMGDVIRCVQAECVWIDMVTLPTL